MKDVVGARQPSAGVRELGKVAITMSSVQHEFETKRFLESLLQAKEQLCGTATEMVMDLSAVRRIDPEVIKQLEELVSVAKSRKIRLVLRGVSVDIYKVLKLMKLSAQFSYVD